VVCALYTIWLLSPFKQPGAQTIVQQLYGKWWFELAYWTTLVLTVLLILFGLEMLWKFTRQMMARLVLIALLFYDLNGYSTGALAVYLLHRTLYGSDQNLVNYVDHFLELRMAMLGLVLILWQLLYAAAQNTPLIIPNSFVEYKLRSWSISGWVLFMLVLTGIGEFLNAYKSVQSQKKNRTLHGTS
jgi:hypothetical protein